MSASHSFRDFQSSRFPAFPDDPNGAWNGIDESDPRARPFLEAVQGNILQAHGREHGRWVFFRFGPDPAGMLRDAAAIVDRASKARKWVTSAAEQRRQAIRYLDGRVLRARKLEAGTPDAGDLLPSDRLLFATVMISSVGMKRLGYASPTPLFETLHTDMKLGMSMLPPETTAGWSAPYTQDFDGLFLLASDDEDDLDHPTRGKVAELRTWCGGHGATVLTDIEHGRTWRGPATPQHPKGVAREAFGFVDGISMPVFFAEDRARRAPPAGAVAPWTWVDLKLDDVFVRPGASQESRVHAGASFVALLKLEQDVALFRRHEAAVAGALSRGLPRNPLPGPGVPLPIDFGALAGTMAPALMIGRTREGVPVAVTRETEPPGTINGFDFMNETPRGVCPFHAHIRRMNPRVDDPHGTVTGSAITKETVVTAQPVRRGMIFDRKGRLKEAEERGAPWPGKGDGVGLLFMAYMRDLDRQFQQLHNVWAWAADFPVKGTTQHDPALFPTARNDPAGSWDYSGIEVPVMPRESVVHRLGGAYFYVPSIPWLENVES